VVSLTGAFGTDSGTGKVADNETAPANVAPVATIGNVTASEAAGEIIIPITLSHASTQDVTLTYEVSAPNQVISFEGAGALYSALPAGYGGVRWTKIDSSGDGGAFTATTGGGEIQALAPNGLSVSSLNVSSASTNKLSRFKRLRMALWWAQRR
jgi:hypothetical protein